MTILERIGKLGLTLPEPPSPAGSYIPAVITGNLLFLSGILPLRNGNLTIRGKVGRDVTVEEAVAASRQVVLNALSVIERERGLESISRCIRLNGYVASANDFYEQPLVINGASDLLYEIFGEKGRHSRTAIGVPVLPLNSPVEIDFIFELE